MPRKTFFVWAHGAPTGTPSLNDRDPRTGAHAPGVHNRVRLTPDGWREFIKHLKSRGYASALVSEQPDGGGASVDLFGHDPLALMFPEVN